jgi:hypothetical protein
VVGDAVGMRNDVVCEGDVRDRRSVLAYDEAARVPLCDVQPVARSFCGHGHEVTPVVHDVRECGIDANVGFSADELRLTVIVEGRFGGTRRVGQRTASFGTSVVACARGVELPVDSHVAVVIEALLSVGVVAEE